MNWVGFVIALAIGCHYHFEEVDGGNTTDGVAVDGTGERCAMVPLTCGQNLNASCCASGMVGGGTFYRGYDLAADMMFVNMSAPATVTTFLLDTYEVTVGRFRQFVAVGLGTQANPPAAGSGARMLNGMANQGGWDPAWNASLPADTTALLAAIKCQPGSDTWTDAPGLGDNRPIVCITWFEAMAFCAWDGGFLPTEAESLYAASGGSLQRAYPWSNPAASLAIDCGKANFNPGTQCAGGPNAVGSESPPGDGVWGQADLAGNVWEWVLDWYVAGWIMPCSDCAQLIDNGTRALRGGGFDSDLNNTRSAVRHDGAPTTRSSDFGVRCARKPS